MLRRLFSVALSVGSRLPGITWHSALWSPDFPPPSNFHRGQRLSNRLSAAQVNGRAAEEQVIKAFCHSADRVYSPFCLSSAA
ncbi:hypothetical protein EMIT0373P_30904 [Pseudomonas chlororaphis]